MSQILEVLKLRSSQEGGLFCQTDLQTGIMNTPKKTFCSFQFKDGMVHITSTSNSRQKKSMTESEFVDAIFNGGITLLTKLDASDLKLIPERRVRFVVQKRQIKSGDYALAPNGLVAKIESVGFGPPQVKKYQNLSANYAASEWKPIKFVITADEEPEFENKYVYDKVKMTVVTLDPEDREYFENNKKNLERIVVLSNEFPFDMTKAITGGYLQDGDVIK